MVEIAVLHVLEVEQGGGGHGGQGGGTTGKDHDGWGRVAQALGGAVVGQGAQAFPPSAGLDVLHLLLFLLEVILVRAHVPLLLLAPAVDEEAGAAGDGARHADEHAVEEEQRVEQDAGGVAEEVGWTHGFLLWGGATAGASCLPALPGGVESGECGCGRVGTVGT